MINISKAYLRDAAPEDVDILYTWANDSDCRKNSFATDTIPYETHVQWYRDLLNNKQSKQYIFIIDGKPVGQIRVNVDDKVAEISYSIAPDYRCMGYGKLLISLMPDAIKNDFPSVKKLVAQVKPDNIASKKAFIDNNYFEKSVVYELDITTAEEDIEKCFIKPKKSGAGCLKTKN